MSLSERIRARLTPSRVAELSEAAQATLARTEAALPFERTGRRDDGEIVPNLQPTPAAPLAPADPVLEWTMVHVMDRLEEAVEILGRLPANVRPKEFGNGMPTVVQQKLSLLDQIQMEVTGDLEVLVDTRNAVRRSATAAEISRMDQALAWPADYLKEYPEVAKAVGLAALWAVMRADVAKQCRRRKIAPRTFTRRKMHGLKIITIRLIQDRVPVS